MADVFNVSTVHEKFRDLNDLRAFATRLITLWDKDRGQGLEMKPEYAKTGGPLIWSNTHHVVELTRTVLELSRQDRIVIAIPLIRLIVENTMTAVWLYLTPPAARAVIHEGLRQRKASLSGVLKLGAEGFTEEGILDAVAQLESFEADRLPAGQHFEQRCNQIADGPGVYATYRIMSSYSHAGLAMADFYLVPATPTPSNPLSIAVNPEAVLDNHEAWLGTAVSMLLAAMKVWDFVDAKGRRTTQIANAAKRLGITLDFALAQHASPDPTEEPAVDVTA